MLSPIRPRLGLLACIALLSTSPPASAIIGGYDAESGSFPWLAAIVKKGDFDFVPVIGSGILLGDRWLLTTAHSLTGETLSSFEIWFGTENLSDPTGRIRRNALSIRVHPGFQINGGTSEADLVMVLLDKPVGDIAAPTLLTDSSFLTAGTPARTAGWGITEPSAPLPTDILQALDLEIVDTAFASPFFGGLLHDAHLAAKDSLEISTPCHGDSGGPLLVEIDSELFLAGLVSFGTADCDDASVPTIFTNLATYSDWIAATLALTVDPPALRVTGRSRLIRNGDTSPRRTDNTHFGTIRSRHGTRVHAFRLANAGEGLLFPGSTEVVGRRFSLRSRPSRVVAPEGSTTIRIRYRASAARPHLHRAFVRLRTNDPGAPVHRFRIAGGSR